MGTRSANPVAKTVSVTTTVPAAGLTLSVAQNKKLADLNSRYRDKATELRKSYSAKRDELTKLINQPNADLKRVRPLMREMADIQADMMLAQAYAQRARNSVYTPQQKAAMQQKPAIKAGGCGSSCGASTGGRGGGSTCGASCGSAGK